jgi:hypothetical protein
MQWPPIQEHTETRNPPIGFGRCCEGQDQEWELHPTTTENTGWYAAWLPHDASSRPLNLQFLQALASLGLMAHDRDLVLRAVRSSIWFSVLFHLFSVRLAG